ncbi:MAG: hypothetical protein H6577_18365 [Lewinellaceae bacterium]|nr:hypothetical protein [Saprospiraceae bacterium]MCB9340091.1 hypothetical protein [Lewinellaceae bacterium]
MKTIGLLLLPTLYVLSGFLEFTNVEGRFRIIVPGDLTEKVDSISTAVGKIGYHTFFYQSTEQDADNLFYMVSYCDYPEGIIFADSTGLAEEFFQSTMEEAAHSVKGKVLYSTDIQLENYPGKYWRIDYLDGKAVIKTKAYLAGNRFYTVQTISYQEKNINAAGDRFFDSFRIL